MASVFPFRAWHPQPQQVEQVSCPPYDVIDTKEARALAEDKPQSFLHVIRPEIDLPKGTPYNNERVYQQGAENLQQFIKEQTLVQEQEASLYIYQLEWNGTIQTGLFCCVSVHEYDNETILKHELTRPDKEDDRTKHILTQQAHAEPVMLTYKESLSITDMQKKITENKKPLFSFKASDHVKHRLWKVTDEQPFTSAFKEIEQLYIADGHHRCKSASRAAQTLNKGKDNAANYFPAVVFPSSQMQILAYNRLVHDLPENFIDNLYKQFDVVEGTTPSPQEKGLVSIYVNNTWLGIELSQAENADSVEKLDVYRLQEYILDPLMNINDQRRDKNISFVGGIRGTDELENKVNAGQAELAISLFPTAIEELMAVSDEDSLMPPKSTWFEPKLRSGLLIHTF